MCFYVINKVMGLIVAFHTYVRGTIILVSTHPPACPLSPPPWSSLAHPTLKECTLPSVGA